MLSDVEKRGFQILLFLLNDSELMSLVDTVTKRQIKVDSRKEAIEALLIYTEKANELLRRKKMKREYLFKYLVKEHVVVNVDSDKRTLIEKILEYWGSDDVLTDSMDINMEEDIKPDVKLNIPKAAFMSSFPDRNDQTVETGSHDFKPVLFPTSFSQTDPVLDTHPLRHSTSHFACTPEVDVPQFHQQSVQTVTQFAISGNQSVASVQNQPNVASGQLTRDETQKLGESFARWFYQMLNSNNPSTGDAPQDFGPHHFWDEATLSLYTNVPMQSQDDFEGSVFVSQRMLALVKEDQLIFNPNIGPEGLFVKTNPHGLVLIMVCGTLHRGNSCLGIFQHVFGIIRDPRFDNNWKVKVMKLRLNSTEVNVMPKLTGNIESELNALIPVQ